LRLRSLWRATIIAIGASAIAGLGALPAYAANFGQDWSSSASYRASIDFIPSGSSITVYGKACGGGDATAFNMSLLLTQGSVIVWNSGQAPANGVVYNMGGAGTSAGTAYYFRWRGLRNGSPYYGAPCQHVGATPVLAS
jgi:hypothetical protein